MKMIRILVCVLCIVLAYKSGQEKKQKEIQKWAIQRNLASYNSTTCEIEIEDKELSKILIGK